MICIYIYKSDHWFVDNKLSIPFGEDKTKSILFTSKHKIKKLQKLEIIYNNIRIKQHSQVTYLGCILQLDKISHISQKEFETINWLPIKERYFDNQCPHYLNEVFMKAPESSSC